MHVLSHLYGHRAVKEIDVEHHRRCQKSHGAEKKIVAREEKKFWQQILGGEKNCDRSIFCFFGIMTLVQNDFFCLLRNKVSLSLC